VGRYFFEGQPINAPGLLIGTAPQNTVVITNRFLLRHDEGIFCTVHKNHNFESRQKTTSRATAVVEPETKRQ
jgi:hypothetical protein